MRKYTTLKILRLTEWMNLQKIHTAAVGVIEDLVGVVSFVSRPVRWILAAWRLRQWEAAAHAAALRWL